MHGASKAAGKGVVGSLPLALLRQQRNKAQKLRKQEQRKEKLESMFLGVFLKKKAAGKAL